MITVKKFPHFFRNSLHFFLLLIIIHFSILSKKTAGKTDGFLLLIITAPAVIISMTFHEQYSFYFRLFIRILCDHRYTCICNFSAEFLNQFDRSFDRSACSNQVIYQHNFLSRFDGIFVDFNLS